jgi:hypothetical protein
VEELQQQLLLEAKAREVSSSCLQSWGL